MEDAFYNPQGIHISSSDKMYVADTGNGMIREISFNQSNVGSVTTSTVFASSYNQEWILHVKLLKELYQIQN